MNKSPESLDLDNGEKQDLKKKLKKFNLIYEEEKAKKEVQ